MLSSFNILENMQQIKINNLDMDIISFGNPALFNALLLDVDWNDFLINLRERIIKNATF